MERSLVRSTATNLGMDSVDTGSHDLFGNGLAVDASGKI